MKNGQLHVHVRILCSCEHANILKFRFTGHEVHTSPSTDITQAEFTPAATCMSLSSAAKYSGIGTCTHDDPEHSSKLQKSTAMLHLSKHNATD